MPVDAPLRLLVIGHSMVNPSNRRKLDCLAKIPGMALTLIIPHRWTGSHGEQYAPPAFDGSPYPIQPHRVFCRGRNCQHLYFYAPTFLNQLDCFKPQMVLIEEEPYSLATFQVARAARQQGWPFLLTTFQNLAKTRPPPFCWTERFVLRHAAGLLVGSRTTDRTVRSKGFSGPSAVVDMGVDPDEYRPGRDSLLRRKLGLDGVVIGFVGRLVAVKGVDLLLSAVAAVESLTLVVIGDGPQKAMLQALANELRLGNRVRWIDTLPHSQVPQYLGLLDGLVLPSRTMPTIVEQFGRILVEAMACGVPVIGSTSGEIPRVIGSAGLLFPEGDVNALINCLEEIRLSPSRREELAAAGRERVLTAFTWDIIARKIAGLCREVAVR